MERVSETFEKKAPLGLTLVDVSKTFDIISYAILLEKLKNCGVDGVVLSTVESYLKNRTQNVVVLDSSFCELCVGHGVPQGSILGPLLFILLVNDFSGLSEALLYADDTAVSLKEQHWKTLQLWRDVSGTTNFS